MKPFKSVLKIFYDSILDKHAELENNYSKGDWENYTIKIHALKSSARLVDALELGTAAEQLEMAGKGDNITYIKENHAPVMKEYIKYREVLAPIFNDGGEDAGEEESSKPVADDFIMESIYDELRSAADDMDCEKVQAILKEAGEYTIPSPEQERFDLIREKAGMYDYDGILEALG
ncbi:MAG: Hpt domain-containing protein [Lachnospiraceae bacterium]|nr:Hpt domain-containing protein [Lachnospiraceae bacterium]